MACSGSWKRLCFLTGQAYIDAVWFWEAEGWSEEYPNNVDDTVQGLE